MDLVKMKAKVLGTVVGDVVNAQGEVNSGCIVHVDPDNHLEEGRYSDPLVTEDVAKKLENAGFAERVGTAKLEKGFLISGTDASAAADRVKQAAGIDADAPGYGVSGLDTSQSIAFPAGDASRTGAGPVADDADLDEEGEDAPPAPAKAPPAKKPAAAK